MEKITFEPRVVEVPCKKCGKITQHIETWYPSDMVVMHYIPYCNDCLFEKQEEWKSRKRIPVWVLPVAALVFAIIVWGLLYLTSR